MLWVVIMMHVSEHTHARQERTVQDGKAAAAAIKPVSTTIVSVPEAAQLHHYTVPCGSLEKLICYRTITIALTLPSVIREAVYSYVGQ